jgi:hypothetical protein
MTERGREREIERKEYYSAIKRIMAYHMCQNEWNWRPLFQAKYVS